MTKRLRKLFNGFASIRSGEIDLSRRRRENLVLYYEGEVMTIPLAQLTKEHLFQLHSKSVPSKFGTEPFQLYDFKFIPDNKKVDNVAQATQEQKQLL